MVCINDLKDQRQPLLLLQLPVRSLRKEIELNTWIWQIEATSKWTIESVCQSLHGQWNGHLIEALESLKVYKVLWVFITIHVNKNLSLE